MSKIIGSSVVSALVGASSCFGDEVAVVATGVASGSELVLLVVVEKVRLCLVRAGRSLATRRTEDCSRTCCCSGSSFASGNSV